MKLFSNRALREFAGEHADAEAPLQAWRRAIEQSEFSNFSELRATFGSVDKVGDKYVFNIGGNKYRLVVWLHFATRRCFVKAVLTHTEYDREKWK